MQLTVTALLFAFLAGLSSLRPTLQAAEVASPPNTLTTAERAAGWRLLFDGQSTAAWRNFKKPTFPTQGWVAEDGWLHCLGKHGGDIITRDQFDNFEFVWEWKLAPGGNSGVKYFLTETRGGPIGHEYQLIDDDRHPDAKVANGKHLTAGVYDVFKPTGAKPNPPDAINQSRLVVRGNHVEHWLNGKMVLEYECGSTRVKAAVAQSKFRRTPHFGEHLKGHLLLQDHHSEVWFRNLKIRELPAKP